MIQFFFTVCDLKLNYYFSTALKAKNSGINAIKIYQKVG